MDKIFEVVLLKIGSFTVTAGSAAFALALILVSKIITYIITSIFLKRYFKKRDIDPSRSYAVTRIIRYLIYFITFLLILKVFGTNLSVVFLGSAGLLVGIGFGLQNTFLDFLSGVILLVEGSIGIGDVIVVDGMVGVVKKIGMRTSEVKTRDQVIIIIPNSKLTNDKVINWSHNDSPARFSIDVGVAYGSNIDLVEQTILGAINNDINVLENPKPVVQLVEYGSSSLDFKLYFYSDEFFFIEKVKSDLRKKILKAFNINKIEIPFPQTDLWIKNEIKVKED